MARRPADPSSSARRTTALLGGGLAVLTLALALGAPSVWLGAWTTLVAGLGAALAGARAGLAVLGAAALLLWLVPGSAGLARLGAADAAVLAAGLFAAAAGAFVHERDRRATRAARDGGRRAQLLVEAALDLGDAPDEAAVLAALPPLVARVLAFEHASVLRADGDTLELLAMVPPLLPPGTRIPTASIAGRAARTGVPQHVPDAAHDPDYRSVPNVAASGSELALPLVAGGRVAAVLNVERARSGAFDPEDRTSLEALARIAEAHLGRLRTVAEAERGRREADLLAVVAQRLAHLEEPRAAAAAALDQLVAALGLEGGVVFTLERGALRALAATADLPADVRTVLERGVPWREGRLHQAWRDGRPRYVSDDAVENPEGRYRALGLRAVAIVPVLDPANETIAIVALGSRAGPRAWEEDERRQVEAVAAMLGATLARTTQRAREVELLDVVRGMAQSDDTEELYRRAIEAAVRLVPGAEAASLLVRDEAGTYVFAAAEGFELDALRAAGPLTEAEQLVWYGDGVAGYRSGAPRLRTGDAIGATSAAAAPQVVARQVFEGPGRTQAIRANVCTPIAFQGDVVGILNVDAFTHEDAFGRRALALAEALGQHVAVMIRQAHDRTALARSALVDPLTGAGNREAFNRKVAEELARAQRHDLGLALAMLDLDGFKRVNDTLGHAAGDRALTLVARALREAMRVDDALFRWGGDEFAVVMPMTSADDARTAVARLAAAVRGVEVEGLRLGVSAGIAAYPDDGRDAEALMRRADDLMYASKGSGTR